MQTNKIFFVAILILYSILDAAAVGVVARGQQLYHSLKIRTNVVAKYVCGPKASRECADLIQLRRSSSLTYFRNHLSKHKTLLELSLGEFEEQRKRFRDRLGRGAQGPNAHFNRVQSLVEKSCEQFNQAFSGYSAVINKLWPSEVFRIFSNISQFSKCNIVDFSEAH